MKLNVQRRQQRTLKRARGKRFHPNPKNAACKKKKLRETRRQAKQRNRKKEKKRKKKPQKLKVKAYTLSEVQSSLKELRSSGWLRHEKICSCGDKLVQCPLRLSVKRGAGRVYLRCAGCRRWYDAVAFSSLPALKMPLPLLLAAMKRYFHGPHAESFTRCAEALGMSGKSKTCTLARLWNALSMAETRCMDHMQCNRVLTGLFVPGWAKEKTDPNDQKKFLFFHSKHIDTLKSLVVAYAGDLEVDATTVRKWRDGTSGRNVYYQIFGVYKRTLNSRSIRPVLKCCRGYIARVSSYLH